ncbi:hypothetical protein VNI00_018686 [Paramarasmius palmivorus]|uniref:F-box domain-containing protein n=1 Tax=Paramarasmius palmivorus TaxID=297713 RepID=A0AAW0AV10_9AGAR
MAYVQAARWNDDILLAIFQHLVAEPFPPRNRISVSLAEVYRRPNFLSANYFAESHRRPDLLSVLFVCRDWNVVAVTNSSLWANLQVVHPNAAMLPAIRNWLSRAEDRPLNLSLVHLRPHGDRGAAACEVLREFVLRFRQWKSITVVAGHLIPLPLRLDESMAGENPLLEYAEFRHDDVVPFDISFAFWTVLMASPALRRLTWSGRSINADTQRRTHDLPLFEGYVHPIGWDVLRELRTSITVDNSSAIFLSSTKVNQPYLESVDIPLNFTPHPVGPLVTLDSLQSLVYCGNPQYFSRVIPIAENLTSLSLRFPSMNMRMISEVLEERGRTLTRFECGVFEDNGASGGMFVMFGRTLPVVRSVRLVYQHNLRRPWLMQRVQVPYLKEIDVCCEKQGCQEFARVASLWQSPVLGQGGS